MIDYHSTKFIADQFRNQNKDIVWLCQTIQSNGYELGELNAPENTIEWLNEILERTNFFDAVAAQKGSLDLTGEIVRLRDETAHNRKRSFRELSQNEQQAVMRLNRLTLEAAHPHETPKCGYQLVALIRNKKGDSFLQEYRNREQFSSDMKEHREDVAWGLLVHCDRGKVIANYFPDLGDKAKIGPVDTEPESVSIIPEGLSPQEAALREAAIRTFKSNKLKTYILDQLEHVSGSLQLSKAISFLFDENGKPPALVPVEDIIAEREKIEVKMRWLNAISLELQNSLALIKEVEESALQMLDRCQSKV
jgi:hypothetical protein